MAIQIQRGQVSLALSKLLNVKGEFPLAIDQTIVPTVNIGDLLDNPALRYGIPVARGQTVNAAAALYSGVVFSPGAAVALQIEQIRISTTAAAAMFVICSLLTAAQIAALTNAGTSVQFVDLTSGQDGVGAPVNRPSILRRFQDAAWAGSAVIDVAMIPASGTVTLDLKVPLCLYGNDPGGVPGLAIYGQTLLQAISVSGYGREWPLPGL